jgi:hypothetical protein
MTNRVCGDEYFAFLTKSMGVFPSWKSLCRVVSFGSWKTNPENWSDFSKKRERTTIIVAKL